METTTCSQEQSKKHLDEVAFIHQFNRVAGEIYRTAVSKGWYEKPREDGTVVALIHSELSEALEGLRHGNPLSDKIGHAGYTQAEEEMADAIIRIMDTAQHKGWNIPGAILSKMEYNNKRTYRHGGKQF